MTQDTYDIIIKLSKEEELIKLLGKGDESNEG